MVLVEVGLEEEVSLEEELVARRWCSDWRLVRCKREEVVIGKE